MLCEQLYLKFLFDFEYLIAMVVFLVKKVMQQQILLPFHVSRVKSYKVSKLLES